jgi:RimJ/RimL family protein N-acetyltransferase
MIEPVIFTERLGLRKWIDADFIPFAEINKDSEVMEYFPRLLTDNETSEMIKRINSHFDKYGFGLFAVEKLATKEFIGFTGFMVPTFDSFFTPCIEIGWRIKKTDWGKGYATEAAKACLHYGFKTLQFAKVYSFTSVINLRSEKVMQKIGMVKAGEFDHPNIPRDNPLCRHVLYEKYTDKNKI